MAGVFRGVDAGRAVSLRLLTRPVGIAVEADARTVYARGGRPTTLRLVDDKFVVARPGDEVALAFDAELWARRPAGWTRTFLLHADGFSKEMNINSSSPDEAGPLPSHRMTAYPYPAP